MSLLQYITAPQISVFWLVCATLGASVFGMISHWFKVYFKDKNKITFLKWFLFSNFKGTCYAIAAVGSATLAYLAPIDIQHFSLYQAITQGLAIGYAADSIFNSAGQTVDPSTVKV